MKRLRTWPWQRMLTLGLTLRARIIFGTILPVAAISVFFFHNLHAQKQLGQTVHDILDRRMMMMHSAERIKQALVAYDDALFRYLAIHDPDQLREERRWKTETESNLSHLETLSSSPLIQERLRILQDESEQYFVDAEELLSYAQKTGAPTNVLKQLSSSWSREQGRQHLELAFLSAEGKARLVRVFSLCEEILTVNRLELERAQAEINQVLNNTRRAGLILSVISTLTLVLLAVGFTLSLLSSLRSLLFGIRRIQEGDLDVEIPVATNDEVGELTQAFNHATRLIREQREQLLQETITDGLTGAYNQRHFRKILRQEVERAQRSGDPLSLLMIDVDHFKEYNDTFGHEFGNEMLRKVSALILETIRDVDVLARYGGDEFAVILPQSRAAQSLVLAQRILEGISVHGALKTRADTAAPHLSISIGGATFPDNGSSAEALIRRADAALYQAKEAGRARARWAEERKLSASSFEEAPH